MAGVKGLQGKWWGVGVVLGSHRELWAEGVTLPVSLKGMPVMGGSGGERLGGHGLVKGGGAGGLARVGAVGVGTCGGDVEEGA